MKWYYKYLPYYLLERKLQAVEDFQTVKYIQDKEISVNLLEIQKGVWIAANKKYFLESKKQYLEEKLKEINEELEGLQNELSKMD